MGTINAYRDSSDPKVVRIVPSGFQPGETSPVNVKFNLTGYDEKIVTFTAQDTLIQQPVVTDVGSVSGFVNSTRVINVTTQGTFTATCDNANISLALDQSQRTITITVASQNQTAEQNGNITVSISGYADKVIPVALAALDTLTISGVPSGQAQYVTETIRHTVSGTTRTVSVRSTEPTVQIDKVPGQDYQWDVTATQANNGVRIYFEGEGIKTTYKIYDFQELITLTASPDRISAFEGESVDVTITNGSNIQASSDNSDIETSVLGDVVTVTARSAQSGNVTVTADHANDLTIPAVFTAKTNIVGSLNVASGTQYVGEEYTLELTGDVDGVNCVSSEPRIKVTKTGTSPITYRVYTEQSEGITAVSGRLIVTGTGRNDLVLDVAFKELIELNLTEVSNNVPFDIPAEFTITNGIAGMSVSSSDSKITPRIENQGGTYKLIATAGEIATGTMTITGRGIVEKTQTITFVDKDTLSLSVSPDKASYYLDEEVTITVTGTSRSISVSSSDVNVRVTPGVGGTYTVSATQASASATITFSGAGVHQATKSLTFEDLITLTASPTTITGYVGEEETVTITGATTINAQSDNRDISVSVSGTTIRVNAQTSQSGNITVTADHAKTLTIPVMFAEKQQIAGGLNVASGEQYIGEEYELSIRGSVPGVNCVSSDPRVKVTKKQGSDIKYRIYTEQADGLTSVSADLTVSGTDMNDLVVPVMFKEVKEIRLNEVTNNVPYDYEAVFEIENSQDVISASTTVQEFSASISGTRLTVTSSAIASGDVTISGRGIVTKTQSVTFTDKDTATIVFTPDKSNYYIDETFDVTVTGTTRDVQITSSDLKVSLAKHPTEKNKWTASASSPASNVEFSLSGKGVKDTTKQVEFIDLITMTANPSSVSGFLNTPVDITVSGVSTVQASSDNSDISVSVLGNVVTVNASSEQRGHITITADHAHDLSVPVVYSALPSIVGSLNVQSGNQFIGEEYILTVNGTIPGIQCSSSEPRIKVEDVSSAGVSKYRIYTEEADGITAIAGNIEVTGTGYQSFTLNVSFKALAELTLTPVSNNIPFDMEAEFDITNGVPGMLVSSNEPAITPVIEASGSSYKLKATSTGIATGDITISGRGIVSKVQSVVFTDKDTITITADPDQSSYYVGEPTVITVSGTSRNVSVRTSDSKLVATPVPSEDYKWSIDATASVNADVIVTGTGVKETTKSFAFAERGSVQVVMPSNMKGVYYVGETFQITFTGSSNISNFNVTSSNPDITIVKDSGDVWTMTSTNSGSTVLTISGDSLLTFTHNVTITPLRAITTTSDRYEASYQEVINVPLSGITDPVSVSTSDPKISATINKSVLTITTTAQVTGTVSISGRGYETKVINVVFDNRVPSNVTDLDYDIEPSGVTQYVGRSYVVRFTNAPAKLNVVASDNRIHVRQSTIDPMEYIVSSDKAEGVSAISGNVTFSASGYRTLSIPVEFKEIEVPSIREITNGIPYDQEVVLEVTGITSKPEVFIVESGITCTIEEDNTSGLKYIVKFTSAQPIDSVIRIQGEGIETTAYIISFIELDRMRVYVESQFQTFYVGDTIKLKVVGIDVVGREYDLPSSPTFVENGSGDIDITPVPGKPGEFTVKALMPGNVTVTFSHKGNETTSSPVLYFNEVRSMTIVDVENLGTRYLNEVATFKILPEGLSVTADIDDKVNGTLTEVSSGVYKISASSASTITLTTNARGYREAQRSVKFIEPVTVSLVPDRATVSRGEVIRIPVPDIQTPYTVEVTGDGITSTLVNNPAGGKIIELRSVNIISGTVKIIGRGITSNTASVSFVIEDSPTIGITSSYSQWYVNETLVVNILGTNKQFNFAVEVINGEDDATVENINGTSYRLGKTTGGTIRATVSGPGIKTTSRVFTFADLEIPVLRFNLSYPNFYVNETPLLLVTCSLPHTLSTDDGQGDSSVIRLSKVHNHDYYEVTCSKACNGTITISGRGIETVTLPTIFEELSPSDVEYMPANGIGYVGKGILISSANESLSVSVDTPDIDVTPVS